MANAFEYNADMIYDGAMILSDSLTVGSLVNRNVESKFTQKKGKTVDVTIPADLGAANLFTSSVSDTDIQDVSQSITLDRHWYQSVLLTSDQMKFEMHDFTDFVLAPMIKSIAESIDAAWINGMMEGFAPNTAGTGATSPSTMAHILAGRKLIKDNRGKYENIAGIIDTTSEASFLALDQFINMDYGTERPQAMRDASLGRMQGASFFASQNVGTHDRGYITGTVLVDGASQTGTSLLVNGFTAATGTTSKGTKVTIAGVSGTYTLAADAVIAGNSTTYVFDETLASAPADDAAITFVAASKQNLLYNTAGVYGAIVAPEEFRGTESAVGIANGLSVRSSFFASKSDLGQTFIVDVYEGISVIEDKYGVVLGG